MNNMLRVVILSLIAASVFVLFVGSCFLTASDGQGAFVFIISTPIALGILGLGIFLTSNRVLRFFRILLLVEGTFWILFLIGAFVSPLKPFSQSVVTQVAKASEFLTGMSPYTWARRNTPAAQALEKNLRDAGNRITLEHMSVVPNWTRICVFAPYTSEDEAAKVIGYYSSTMARSRAVNSDRYVALVFINEQGTIDVLDADRSIVDLVSFSKRCLTAADFPLTVGN